MPAFWLFMFFATTTFTPLAVYNGTWKVTSPHTLAGPGKPDTLVNHCTEGAAFFTCEQVVNGKPVALLVFTATEAPMKFRTNPVLPNGHVLDGGDLTIDGDHWTFLGSGKGKDGKPVYYRTENYFTGRDKIHSDQYQSDDNKTWVKTNEADEVRVQ